MLVLVQFPYADLRHFAGANDDVVLGANWKLPPELKDPDFVRGFGPLRKRPKSDAAAISAWPGEAWFARAFHALRFPQLSHACFPRAGVTLVPQLALRRVFCNGKALWRVEIGLAFDPRTEPDLKQTLAAIADFLALPIRVRRGPDWGAAAPLATQAGPIGKAIAQATTFKDTTPAERALGLKAGRPMVLVETRSDPAASLPADSTHRVTLPGASAGVQVDIEYGTLAVDGTDCPLVFLRAPDNVRGQQTRDLRTHLCRLHAEREVLTQVLRASHRGKITQATGRLEKYFTQARSELFALTRFGVDQSQLQQIFDVYDRITPAESKALKDLLDGRVQSIGRVTELVETYRDGDGRPVIHIEAGGTIVMNDKRVIVGGDLTGIVNIDSTFTNTGQIIQGAGNDQLKAALGTLKDLTAQLVEKIPDAGQKEEVANRLEAMAKAATSAKPDKGMLAFTGKGLVDAAKTVAEMAGPIATAVGAVLGILGVAM